MLLFVRAATEKKPEVKAGIRVRQITALVEWIETDTSTASALLALEGAAQITAANQIVAKKMSVREAEALVKKLGAEFALAPPKARQEKSGDLRRLEEDLSDLLAAQVEVRIKKRVKRHGKVEETGELAIQFGSIDALNGLIARLRQ